MNWFAFLLFIFAFLFCVCLASPSDARFLSVTNEANHPPPVGEKQNHGRALLPVDSTPVDSTQVRAAYDNVVLTDEGRRFPTHSEFVHLLNEASEFVYWTYMEDRVVMGYYLMGGYQVYRRNRFRDSDPQLLADFNASQEHLRNMRNRLSRDANGNQNQPQNGTTAPIRMVNADDKNDMTKYLEAQQTYLVSQPQDPKRGQLYAYNKLRLTQLAAK